MPDVPKHKAPGLAGMLQIAEAAGCQLRPRLTNRSQLRGLCPFHEADRMKAANTLVVNTREANFFCHICNAHGTSATFAALTWGVCTAEAAKLLELMDTDAIGLARPLPLALREPEASVDTKYRIQNSNLLSRAADFYADQLASSAPASKYLARLGIAQRDLQATRIGYTRGSGLYQYLQDTDTTPDEIRTSPLFATDDGELIESFRSAIVMPDLDIVNAARWLMLLAPICPAPGQPWPEEPPRTLNLRGQRPYIFGYAKTANGSPCLIATDDARIQLVMQSMGVSCCYTLLQTDAGKIADRLAGKRPRAVGILTHNRQLAEQLRERLSPLPVTAPPPSDFLRLLEPSSRDFPAATGGLAKPPLRNPA